MMSSIQIQKQHAQKGAMRGGLMILLAIVGLASYGLLTFHHRGQRVRNQPSDSTRLTIYQNRGAHGEASFSDQSGHGKPVVIDQRNLNVYKAASVQAHGTPSYSPNSNDWLGGLQSQAQQYRQQLQQARERQIEAAGH